MNRKKDYFCTTIKFIENPTQTHWMKHYRRYLQKSCLLSGVAGVAVGQCVTNLSTGYEQCFLKGDLCLFLLRFCRFQHRIRLFQRQLGRTQIAVFF